MWTYGGGGVTSDCKNCIMRNLMICTAHHTWLECQIKEDEMEVVCGAREGEEKCIRNFDKKIWKKRTIWKYKPVWEDYMKRDIKQRTGLVWLSTVTSAGLSWKQQRTFGFHKLRAISSPCSELLASQEEVVIHSFSQSVCWSASQFVILSVSQLIGQSVILSVSRSVSQSVSSSAS